MTPCHIHRHQGDYKMRTIWTLSVVGLAAMALSACAGFEYDKAKMVTPTGDAFSKALHKGYMEEAASEYKQGDYRSADAYSLRAEAAASGKPTAPEAIAARMIPESAKADLTAARQQLVAALDAGAAQKWPDLAARGQVKYECWMEQQEENFQADDIQACRSGFENAMVQIRAAMMPAATPAAAAAPAAPAAKAAAPVPYTIMFGFNSSQIDADANRVVKDVVAAYKKSTVGSVVVSGFADRAGDPAYNANLSQKRAKTVADALVAGGIPRAKIGTVYFGENRSKRATDDGVRSVENRRVEIELKP